MCRVFGNRIFRQKKSRSAMQKTVWALNEDRWVKNLFIMALSKNDLSILKSILHELYLSAKFQIFSDKNPKFNDHSIFSSLLVTWRWYIFWGLASRVLDLSKQTLFKLLNSEGKARKVVFCVPISRNESMNHPRIVLILKCLQGTTIHVLSLELKLI